MVPVPENSEGRGPIRHSVEVSDSRLSTPFYNSVGEGGEAENAVQQWTPTNHWGGECRHEERKAYYYLLMDPPSLSLP